MKLTIKRLAPGRMDDMGCVLRGSWGAGCWCMFPRLGNPEANAIRSQGRRQAMTRLARRRRAPGLMAYEGKGRTVVGTVTLEEVLRAGLG